MHLAVWQALPAWEFYQQQIHDLDVLIEKHLRIS
jgi:hypothetical protein